MFFHSPTPIKSKLPQNIKIQFQLVDPPNLTPTLP
jgi:hypothetical protein